MTSDDRPATGAVWVRWARVTDDPAAAVDLDDVERSRMAGLVHEADRRRFRTSRVALKGLVADLVGASSSAVRLDYACPRCGRQHGRPLVVAPHQALSWQVSLSHSGDRVLVAASDVGPVGVDVELVSGTEFAGFAETALAPTERRALQQVSTIGRARAAATLWTRKEALLKATGQGLSQDPSAFDAAQTEALHGVQARILPAGDEHVAAVAVLTTLPVTWHLPDASGPV
ncbi:4'-phosphopantetheinyl transferase family protein [Angustibacter sp. McL0619]|uniref:4'-phosphopantetheinyl transferase family protein n=1 Tax=Angustibacter sp. McL0619 TaxID=3415676 RepID=UPI003CF6D7DC